MPVFVAVVVCCLDMHFILLSSLLFRHLFPPLNAVVFPFVGPFSLPIDPIRPVCVTPRNESKSHNNTRALSARLKEKVSIEMEGHKRAAELKKQQDLDSPGAGKSRYSNIPLKAMREEAKMNAKGNALKQRKKKEEEEEGEAPSGTLRTMRRKQYNSMRVDRIKRYNGKAKAKARTGFVHVRGSKRKTNK